jgi:hypothetical protein
VLFCFLKDGGRIWNFFLRPFHGERQRKLSDGKLEVVIFPHMSKWRVLLKALRATTQGLGEQPSVNRYEFTTLTSCPIKSTAR